MYGKHLERCRSFQFEFVLLRQPDRNIEFVSHLRRPSTTGAERVLELLQHAYAGRHKVDQDQAECALRVRQAEPAHDVGAGAFAEADHQLDVELIKHGRHQDLACDQSLRNLLSDGSKVQAHATLDF